MGGGGGQLHKCKARKSERITARWRAARGDPLMVVVAVEVPGMSGVDLIDNYHFGWF